MKAYRLSSYLVGLFITYTGTVWADWEMICSPPDTITIVSPRKNKEGDYLWLATYRGKQEWLTQAQIDNRGILPKDVSGEVSTFKPDFKIVVTITGDGRVVTKDNESGKW
jgi:hypothetical protein